MPASEHYFETRRSVRFYLLDEPSEKISTIFFALHGYGFLAKYFARKFEEVQRNDVLFVIPEGLHRYYIKSDQKHVGASWMTKEDRLTDISDQIIYLDGLYKELAEGCPSASRLIVLGFSQGAATAARWAAKSHYKVQDLVLWGGAIPPDLERAEIDRISKMALITVLGDNDEYIDQERFEAETIRLNDLGLEHRVLSYAGGHDIPQEGLGKLISMLSL